ncbi:biotin/lipoyl-containing protein [Anaeropeptidivorans aminofermentans]|uniref:biotin/lipoyl-containing protein n=1 Tax=Anaeropeptidivorans aminofermentans TaxID=2934315 RepID=UPI0020248D81|nr:biotin/lipoyl-containing protein [Anaeropeptidivorans aminofermentans]MBE6012527.1 acetyl-CoA carboxylase biotin carboxyl carrier protein subunit [Lachnospiraceae bacterium]
MKSYKVNVNGNEYNVTIEEVNGQAVPHVSIPAAAPVQAAPAASKAEAPAPVSSGSKGANKVEAPMPGTILSLKVKVGDSVSEHQVIAILEAMKMENEIVAPMAGVVASIDVTPGTSVTTGDVIITLN